MRENIKYMLKNWIAWDKKSPVYFLIRVPALVFQPIVTAYIPKAMIDCIEKGVTTRQLILVVALLSLLLTITIWLDPFMKELILGGARIVRMRYAVAAFEKNLSTDYANIENLEMREKQKRAEVFYNGRYAGGSNFISTSEFVFRCGGGCCCVRRTHLQDQYLDDFADYCHLRRPVLFAKSADEEAAAKLGSTHGACGEVRLFL